MNNIYSRTEMLVGKEAIKTLRQSKIAIFGIGGVGSFVVEGLIRAGVGKVVLIDHDTIDISNLNRQIHATTYTIGKKKVEVMKERILQINPEVEVTTYPIFYSSEISEKILDESIDYIVDAVDTVTAKITIISEAKKLGIPVISCMGTGNKLDPTKFEVTDISKTSVCPLAKVMRKELKKREIKHVKVVYSNEEPMQTISEEDNKKKVPGSISFVPSVAGMIIASEVVKDLLKKKE